MAALHVNRFHFLDIYREGMSSASERRQKDTHSVCDNNNNKTREPSWDGGRRQIDIPSRQRLSPSPRFLFQQRLRVDRPRKGRFFSLLSTPPSSESFACPNFNHSSFPRPKTSPGRLSGAAPIPTSEADKATFNPRRLSPSKFLHHLILPFYIFSSFSLFIFFSTYLFLLVLGLTF